MGDIINNQLPDLIAQLQSIEAEIQALIDNNSPGGGGTIINNMSGPTSLSGTIINNTSDCTSFGLPTANFIINLEAQLTSIEDEIAVIENTIANGGTIINNQNPPTPGGPPPNQLVLQPNDTATFWYDSCSRSKWKLLSTTAPPNIIGGPVTYNDTVIFNFPTYNYNNNFYFQCNYYYSSNYFYENNYYYNLNFFYNITYFYAVVNFYDIVFIYAPIFIQGPIEICNFQFWCCNDSEYSIVPIGNGSNGNTLRLDEGSTVYLLNFGDDAISELHGITPVPIETDGPIGPLLIQIINSGPNFILIVGTGLSDAAGGSQILIPNSDFLTLNQNDAVLLWYDTCSGGIWRVLNTTAVFGGRDVNPSTGLVPNPNNFDMQSADPSECYLGADARWHPLPQFYDPCDAFTGIQTVVTGVSCVGSNLVVTTVDNTYHCGLLLTAE